MPKSKRIKSGDGVPCRKCGQVATRYEHGPEFIPPTDKKWYPFWFQCGNDACPTTMFTTVPPNPPRTGPAEPIGKPSGQLPIEPTAAALRRAAQVYDDFMATGGNGKPLQRKDLIKLMALALDEARSGKL